MCCSLKVLQILIVLFGIVTVCLLLFAFITSSYRMKSMVPDYQEYFPIWEKIHRNPSTVNLNNGLVQNLTDPLVLTVGTPLNFLSSRRSNAAAPLRLNDPAINESNSNDTDTGGNETTTLSTDDTNTTSSASETTVGNLRRRKRFDKTVNSSNATMAPANKESTHTSPSSLAEDIPSDPTTSLVHDSTSKTEEIKNSSSGPPSTESFFSFDSSPADSSSIPSSSTNSPSTPLLANSPSDKSSTTSSPSSPSSLDSSSVPSSPSSPSPPSSDSPSASLSANSLSAKSLANFPATQSPANDTSTPAPSSANSPAAQPLANARSGQSSPNSPAGQPRASIPPAPSSMTNSSSSGSTAPLTTPTNTAPNGGHCIPEDAQKVYNRLKINLEHGSVACRRFRTFLQRLLSQLDKLQTGDNFKELRNENLSPEHCPPLLYELYFISATSVCLGLTIFWILLLFCVHKTINGFLNKWTDAIFLILCAMALIVGVVLISMFLLKLQIVCVGTNPTTHKQFHKALMDFQIYWHENPMKLHKDLVEILYEINDDLFPKHYEFLKAFSGHAGHGEVSSSLWDVRTCNVKAKRKREFSWTKKVDTVKYTRLICEESVKLYYFMAAATSGFITAILYIVAAFKILCMKAPPKQANTPEAQGRKNVHKSKPQKTDQRKPEVSQTGEENNNNNNLNNTATNSDNASVKTKKVSWDKNKTD